MEESSTLSLNSMRLKHQNKLYLLIFRDFISLCLYVSCVRGVFNSPPPPRRSHALTLRPTHPFLTRVDARQLPARATLGGRP